jgi:hypothetical protein
MDIFRAAQIARHLRLSSVGSAILVVTLAATAACGRPANLNLSLDRPTNHNLFRVAMASGTSPVPIPRVHQWSVHVAGADGKPVTGARLTIDGGMPEHGHGLPTAPRAEPAGTPGDYVIKGMKFSMTGWWVLKLDVRAPDGRADNITFNVVL